MQPAEVTMQNVMFSAPVWGEGVVVFSCQNPPTPDQFALMANMMGQGFARSRLMQHWAAGRGIDGIADLMRMTLQAGIRWGLVASIWERGLPVSVAVWIPPGVTVPLWWQAGLLPQMWRGFGLRGAALLLADLLALERVHTATAKEVGDHWYLLTVVTVPSARGCRNSADGSQRREPLWLRLVRPVLDAADQDGHAAYLESDDTAHPPPQNPNSRRYAALGFTVVDPGGIPISVDHLRRQYLAMVWLPASQRV